MPVEETTVTNITCDNPACPGHPELDPTSRTGWLFISSEVYGDPVAQHVFGSADCLATASADPASGFPAPPSDTPIPPPPAS
jgi:hypothetical protein